MIFIFIFMNTAFKKRECTSTAVKTMLLYYATVCNKLKCLCTMAAFCGRWSRQLIYVFTIGQETSGIGAKPQLSPV